MHLSVFRGGKRALWGEISRLSRAAPMGVVSAHRGLDGKGRSALPKHPTTPLATGQVNGSDRLTDVSDHGGASTRPIDRERRQAAASPTGVAVGWWRRGRRRRTVNVHGQHLRVGLTLMSKGHGIIQRYVLRELAEAAANTHSRDWVAVVEMGWSSRAKKQAVRRAMKRLADEGYIELFYRPLHEYGERVRTHLCGRITDKGLHAVARLTASTGIG